MSHEAIVLVGSETGSDAELFCDSHSPEHEALKEPLEQLVKDTKPISTTYASLEERTTVLLQRYNDYVGSACSLDLHP